MSTLDNYRLEKKFEINKEYEHKINALLKLKGIIGIIPNDEFNRRMKEIKDEKKEMISKIH